MKAVVYHGPDHTGWEDVPTPAIVDDTDAIISVEPTTICETDLHIVKGDLPTVADGHILGHEAVGTVETVGRGVTTVRAGLARGTEIEIAHLSVDVDGGEATLQGNVHSWYERRAAERAARSVPGVTDVRNQLVVTF